jgi:hypothetical protein
MVGYEPDQELEEIRLQAVEIVEEMKLYTPYGVSHAILQAKLEALNDKWEQIHKKRDPNSYIPYLILND